MVVLGLPFLLVATYYAIRGPVKYPTELCKICTQKATRTFNSPHGGIVRYCDYHAVIADQILTPKLNW